MGLSIGFSVSGHPLIFAEDDVPSADAAVDDIPAAAPWVGILDWEPDDLPGFLGGGAIDDGEEGAIDEDDFSAAFRDGGLGVPDDLPVCPN